MARQHLEQSLHSNNRPLFEAYLGSAKIKHIFFSIFASTQKHHA